MNESNKMKHTFTGMLRFIIHLALNIGPAAKANEDIEEQLKDQAKNEEMESPRKSEADSPRKEELPLQEEPPKVEPPKEEVK